MCRIDAPFGDHPLEEKADSTERFIQALDEFGVTGNFRFLLTNHLSESWIREFHYTSMLEETLKCAQEGTTDAEKCTAFLASAPIARKLGQQFLDKQLTEQALGATYQSSTLIDFTKDVAQEYFSKSPYALFSSITDSGAAQIITNRYEWFVPTIYGADFCFSAAFFDDEVLASLDVIERTDILWNFFDAMSCRGNSLENDLEKTVGSQIKNLISAASLSSQAGPPTRSTHEFLRGVRFLKEWIKFDAESGRLRSISEGVFDRLSREWSKFRSHLEVLPSSLNDEDTLETALKWLDETKANLLGDLYFNMSLEVVTDQELDWWASELDYHFELQKWRDLDVRSATRDELAFSEGTCLQSFCSQLSPLKVESWIRWTINSDIQSQLNGSNRERISREFNCTRSRKWWTTEYSGSWKAGFLEELSGLDIEAKLIILSGRLRLDNEIADYEFRTWWDGLLENLIQSHEFPNSLIPQWTIAAMDRLDEESVVPYIDKSIGLLRGKFSVDWQPEHHQQLEALLHKLDFFQPSKAFRHRLMLMKSSSVPFADESISPISSWNSDNTIAWYLPMKELANKRFATRVNSGPGVAAEEVSQVHKECLSSFAHELVDFCLSRLRLRKGEKATDGIYRASQVIETSPIWRQGYLKALTELGLDPKGKAHKAVYFNKQSDPDEDVREVAKECYRAVRRESKKGRSIEDLKRGIISAEWWLLICQRRELDLDVNYEGALKTRRSLLRNP